VIKEIIYNIKNNQSGLDFSICLHEE